MISTIGDGNDLKLLAGKILGAFAAIADAAGADLACRGVSLDGLAFVNQATAEATAARMREVQPDLFGSYLYVGVTRAATFFGVIRRQQALPPELAPLTAPFGDSW